MGRAQPRILVGQSKGGEFVSRRRMAKLESQLATGDGLARRWRRRRAVEELAGKLSPEGVELLAAEVTRPGVDPETREVALRALERIWDQPQVDALCAQWARSRHPVLGELIVRRGWVATGPSHVRVLSALKAGRPELLADEDAPSVAPLVAALRDSDAAVARNAADGLRALRNPLAIQALASASLTIDDATRQAVRTVLAQLDQRRIDGVCEQWVRSRHRALGALVSQSGWVASKPLDVRVATALHVGRPEALADDGPEVVPLLLAAAHGKRGHPDVQHARRALELLTNPAAQEALCRDVIDNDDPVSAEAARSGGFAPADAADRALFFFLTRQWDRYEELDFDQSLLHAAYTVASPSLRERLAACARADGRRDWVALVAGGRRGRKLGDMTDREWETALAVLSRSKRWDEIWRLAQDASAKWAARFLARLGDAGWVPPEPDDRVAFTSLMAWARGCQGPAPANLLARRGELLHRLPRAVRALGCTADGRTLVVGIPGGGVQFWSIRERDRRATVAGSAGGESAFCFTGDGQSVIGAGRDGVVRLWSVGNPSTARVLGKHAGPAHAVAMVDSRLLVSGGGDKLVRRWDLEDANRRAVWRGHSRTVLTLAVVDQAGLLASGGRDGVRLWSLGGATRPVPVGLEVPVMSLVRISQLQLAVLETSGAVRLWSLPDSGVRALPASTAVTSIGGVADKGMTLLGTSDGRLLSLPRPDAVEPVTVGTGHDGPVTAVAASPAGDVVVTGGADGLILLWEPEVYRWDRVPLGEASADDLQRLETMLRGPIASQERPWLELAAGLVRWRRRHDIELGQAGVIEVGEFDIEIGG